MSIEEIRNNLKDIGNTKATHRHLTEGLHESVAELRNMYMEMGLPVWDSEWTMIDRPNPVHMARITPTLASQMIEAFEAMGHTNRNISDNRVEQYARDLRRNEWDRYASTIHVDELGVPINGIHRLYACVIADLPMETVLVFSPDRENTNKKVDSGRGRSGTDLLHMETPIKKYHAATSAALRMYIRHISGASPGSYINTRIVVTPADIIDYANYNGERIDWMHRCIPHNCASVVSQSKLFFLALGVRDDMLAELDRWWFGVINGYNKNQTGLGPSDSNFLLRERLMAAKFARRAGRRMDTLDEKQSQYLCVKAWMKRDKGISRLQLPRLQGSEGKLKESITAYGIPAKF